MIKTLVLYTNEIDDAELAVKSILEQLNQETLCKNSVGIISFHYDFVSSGAMKAICEALPFDVVGASAPLHGNTTEVDTYLLSIMVLTSDDASFVMRTAGILGEDAYSEVGETYKKVLAEREDTPVVAFSYVPFIFDFYFDRYMEVFTEVSEGVPCFGTVALDDTNAFENACICVNGGHYKDRMAMIFVYGDVKPKFLLGFLSPEKILPQPALITKSQDNILQEVNGHSMEKYFEDLGLSESRDNQYEMASVPFMLDYGDGTPPVSKAFVGQTPEGYAVSAGLIPEGATLKVAVFDKDDVLLTTGKTVEEALEVYKKGASGMLIYSCLARYMSLEGDSMAELDLVRDKLSGSVPFIMAYSGGEICPTRVSESKAINRFHNNTFIVCIF